MGLNVSHGAFDGPYSTFNKFREAVCRATGGSWEKAADGYIDWEFGKGFSRQTHPGLYVFLCHSDCDGKIPAESAGSLADEMEALLPALDLLGTAGGYGFVAMARKWIAGCRDAAAKGEPLLFG